MLTHLSAESCRLVSAIPVYLNIGKNPLNYMPCILTYLGPNRDEAPVFEFFKQLLHATSLPGKERDIKTFHSLLAVILFDFSQDRLKVYRPSFNHADLIPPPKFAEVSTPLLRKYKSYAAELLAHPPLYGFEEYALEAIKRGLEEISQELQTRDQKIN